MSDPTIRESASAPDVSPTMREPAQAATMRDNAAAATVREGQTTTGGSFLRLPEGLAVRYRIERELSTRGNEADLFVVRPLQKGDDTPVVVKLYRAGIEPKEEVLTRIAALDGQHVIRQIDHGVSEGRSYEVIEYRSPI